MTSPSQLRARRARACARRGRSARGESFHERGERACGVRAAARAQAAPACTYTHPHQYDDSMLNDCTSRYPDWSGVMTQSWLLWYAPPEMWFGE